LEVFVAAPTTTRRHPLILSIIVVVALIICYLIFVQLWTRKLWFDSLGFTVVFGTKLTTQILLFAAFFVVIAVVTAVNMWLAYRVRPNARRTGRSQMLDRYRDIIEAHAAWVIAIPAVLFGLVSGTSASGNALMYLAWWNETPFGTADPYYGLDASFYVFTYPVWNDLLSYALSTVALTLVASAAVHFAVGGLASGRPPAGKGQVSPARVHLSILAAVALVIFGLQTLLGRYGFLVQQGTLFTGMQYTDDHARSTARLVMAVILFICAGLFVVNTRLRRWVTPVAGLVLMVVSGLIISLAYPAAVQSFEVKPNEPDKERPYIVNNIAATRQAFDIANVDIQSYSAVTQTNPGQLKNDAEALPGIRLWDPYVASPTFDQLQQVRGYYSFASQLDVDRYTLGGSVKDVVVAARELNQAGLPDPAWNNIHTVYTHGNGLVAAYGNQRQSGGAPVWVEGDLPPAGLLGDFQSRIYFGEQSDQFAIVGRLPGQTPIEFDTPTTQNTYDGTGGVPIGNMWNRILYATYFGDINIALTDRVNADSKILYDRTPQERVQEVAPWLTEDQNIYPSVVDGRLVWIIDCYTTSDSYPDSQSTDWPSAASSTASASAFGIQAPQVNYVRNSVKATVDAYDGTVTLYGWDESDPILQTYEKAFPGTIVPRSKISPDLMAHLRYPEDMFSVQQNMLGRYHVTDPGVWYQQSDLWTIPADPVNHSSDGLEPPYYLSIDWPGSSSPVFSLTNVFVPKSRSNLAGYLAVNADATSSGYGQLRILRMSDTQQIDGPGQTFNAMLTDSTVASLLRPFLNQGSSQATYGNLLTLPMGAGLLYVLPVYTQRQGSTGSYPALSYVIVRFGEQVGVGATLQEALDSVFQGDAGASTGELPVDSSVSGTPPANQPGSGATPAATPSPTPVPVATPTTTPGSAASPGLLDPAGAAVLLQQAQDDFVAADAALKNGDLGTYQQQMNAAQTAVQQAMTKLGK